MSDLDEIKNEVATACRIIGRLGLTREPNGHVSARVPGTEHIVIKARGRGEVALSYVEVSDLAVVDMDGNFVSGREGLASPAEVYIHTQVYRARPEINAAIHIHPANVVAFTIAERGLKPIIGAYNPQALRIVTDGLPLYPRSILINSAERGDDLVQTMGQARACLMRGHGITTAGATVEEAVLIAAHLNELAELSWKAELLGGANPISDADIADFARNLNAPRATSDTPIGPHGAEWRYYVSRLL